jgi:hypothetical protein
MVYENGVLRSIFEIKREITTCWTQRYNEEFNFLHPSSVLIRMIKSRKMRWVSYVAQMCNTKTAYIVSVGKPKWMRIIKGPIYRYWGYSRMNLKVTDHSDRFQILGSNSIRGIDVCVYSVFVSCVGSGLATD